MNANIAFIFFIIGLLFGMAILDTINRNSKQLKCVQGELYKETDHNIFVKSHLECFEQKTLVP